MGATARAAAAMSLRWCFQNTLTTARPARQSDAVTRHIASYLSGRSCLDGATTITNYCKPTSGGRASTWRGAPWLAVPAAAAHAAARGVAEGSYRGSLFTRAVGRLVSVPTSSRGVPPCPKSASGKASSLCSARRGQRESFRNARAVAEGWRTHIWRTKEGAKEVLPAK